MIPIINAMAMVTLKKATSKQGIIQNIEWPYPLCLPSNLSKISGKSEIQPVNNIPTNKWFKFVTYANDKNNTIAPAMWV